MENVLHNGEDKSPVFPRRDQKKRAPGNSMEKSQRGGTLRIP
jgi:hypothetical protein